jgi:hypothetical protein
LGTLFLRLAGVGDAARRDPAWSIPRGQPSGIPRMRATVPYCYRKFL